MDVPSGSVVWEVACPEVVVGGRRFDVRHRAIVLGVLTCAIEVDRILADAEALVGSGADVLELSWSLLAETAAAQAEALIPLLEALVTIGVPLAVDTDLASIRAISLAGGVAMVPDLGDDHLGVVASAAASLLVRLPTHPHRFGDAATPTSSAAQAVAALAERGGAAAAAGIRRADVFLDAGTAGLDLLRSGLASLGSPVVLSTSAGPEATPTQAMGIALGARVLRTRDVRAARRTADVMAAIVAARQERPT